MRIHFIGIGGIGVSALARYYLEKGHKISGSDLVSSEITNALKKSGAKIFIGPHKAKNVPKNVNLIIYSPAVPKNNPELIQQPRLNTQPRVLNYPEALGELTKTHFTIAITGTHGKSTTTAMIGLLLTKAELDPTVIVGTKLKEFGNSNCRVGKSKYLVIEADEHFASFLNYWPKIIVLTSIDVDHLDFYKNLDNILKAFRKFITHLPKDGILVANKDDKRILRMLNSKFKIQNSKLQFKIQNYSLKQKRTKQIQKLLKIPGEHNVSNALAVLTVARVLKIPDRISFRALSEYKGAWRRFEIIEADKRGYLRGFTPKITLVSDYGHHPTEIKATLKAAREKWPRKKIWCVFQPHQYQRTYYLFNDFVKTFKEFLVKNWIQKLIITDIYDVAGREEKKIKKKVGSEKLVKAIKEQKTKNKEQRTIYIPKIKAVANYLKKNLRGREVVIIMGAGDIYHLTDVLKKKKIY